MPESCPARLGTGWPRRVPLGGLPSHTVTTLATVPTAQSEAPHTLNARPQVSWCWRPHLPGHRAAKASEKPPLAGDSARGYRTSGCPSWGGAKCHRGPGGHVRHGGHSGAGQTPEGAWPGSRASEPKVRRAEPELRVRGTGRGRRGTRNSVWLQDLQKGLSSRWGAQAWSPGGPALERLPVGMGWGGDAGVRGGTPDGRPRGGRWPAASSSRRATALGAGEEGLRPARAPPEPSPRVGLAPNQSHSGASPWAPSQKPLRPGQDTAGPGVGLGSMRVPALPACELLSVPARLVCTLGPGLSPRAGQGPVTLAGIPSGGLAATGHDQERPPSRPHSRRGRKRPTAARPSVPPVPWLSLWSLPPCNCKPIWGAAT